MRFDDTIFALSTARGRAGVAVIRLSGPAAVAIGTAVAGRLPPPRGVRLARFRDPTSGDVIDRGLLLRFAAPASVTGEDVVEFHAHGSPAVIGALLNCLSTFDNCRLAEPGEFTRRGFENGRLDLTAAEGIGDLVDAETDAQRRQALRQMGGAIAEIIGDWAARLAALLAHAEAAIDFADEELPPDLLSAARREAGRLAAEIRARLADGRRGEMLRDGLAVAIIGPPNSGKSSLLNALAGREAAIVSAIAGTTRDVIEIHLDLAGYPVVLADTAGIRETADEIEAEGVRRARDRATAADFTLLVLDASADVSRETLPPLDPGRSLTLWNKCDLAPPKGEGLAIAARDGTGLDTLVATLAAQADRLLAGPAPVVTRARHRASLEDCVAALQRATGGDTEPALLAEELRLAMRALGRITGKVDVEGLLDIIFREFCIGK